MCPKTHLYSIFSAATGCSTDLTDETAARDQFEAIDEDLEPLWVAVHADESYCVAETQRMETSYIASDYAALGV